MLRCQTFFFLAPEGHETIHIRVMDEDNTRDEAIGTAEVVCKSINLSDEWLNLESKGTSAALALLASG